MRYLSNIFNNLDWTVLLRAAAVLLCITVHELSHGYVAYRLGDPTAKNMGRLTLNPIKHIDIFGLLMLFLVGFGWAKAVPVDMRNFRSPKLGMAVTALAGPVSNMLLATLALLVRAAIIPFYGGAVVDALITFLELVAVISIGLGLFNLIPIPPLDGSKILFAFLSGEMYYKLMRYERYGFIILIALMYSGVTSNWISDGLGAVLGWLVDVTSFPYYIVSSLLR